MKKFSLDEICDFLEADQTTQEEQKRFSPQGLHCALTGSRGMGGFTLRMLLIPESIQIIVSPAACGRHGDFDLMASGVKDRFYRIRLSEKLIVSGTASEMVCKEVLKMVGSMENRPRVISLCITCVDALLNTDYTLLGKKLREQYDIRFEVVRMFPFLADSVKTHFELLMESMYKLIDVSAEKEKRKAVNIIGKTEMAKPTDFHKLLNQAGYEVQEIHTCKTLEEYDRLGEACLNVVLNKHSLCAAKMMEKKYGIPYIEFSECFSPQEIKQNYERLENVLGCHFDVEAYYNEACTKLEKIREKMKGKMLASGASVDYNPVKFAHDLCQNGFPLKYFTVNKIRKQDLEYYRRMKEYAPATYVYLASDTSMIHFIDNPDFVDYTAGIQYGLVKKIENLTTVKLGEEPYDFETLMAELNRLEEAVSEKKENLSSKTETNIFSRNWSTYKEV